MKTSAFLEKFLNDSQFRKDLRQDTKRPEIRDEKDALAKIHSIFMDTAYPNSLNNYCYVECGPTPPITPCYVE